MHEYSYKVARAFSRINSHGPRALPPPGERDEFYFSGAVGTPAGVVLVYSQRDNPFTTLEFLRGGRMYCRHLPRFYSALGLARVAAKFARELSA